MLLFAQQWDNHMGILSKCTTTYKIYVARPKSHKTMKVK